MAFFRLAGLTGRRAALHVAIQRSAQAATASVCVPTACRPTTAVWKITTASSPFVALSRGFSGQARMDPYKTLGVRRDASDAEIKKAYKEKALSTHPDKHPNDREQAQERFTEVGNAYDILKDPAKRQEYDHTGSVGEGGPGNSQADFARMQQMWMREMMRRRQQQQRQPRPRPFPQVDMEAWVRPDVVAMHAASRACGIDTDYDDRRARYIGKLGTIAKVDRTDQTVKVRIMVAPGRADEVWFGAAALWDPRVLKEGLEVRVAPDVEICHRASRAAGIDEEFDERRSRCAGKTGTVLRVDQSDQSCKVRVIIGGGRADELWFGIAAVEPLRK